MRSFLQKNFTPSQLRNSDYTEFTDFTASDAIYDANVGVTHIILKDENGHCRYVSDVELVMTNDPAITSRFSSEYLVQLKNTILSKPHNPISNLDRDGNPIGGVVLSSSLERDELSEVIEHHQKDFHSQAVETVLAAHAATSDPDPEPEPNNS